MAHSRDILRFKHRDKYCVLRSNRNNRLRASGCHETHEERAVSRQLAASGSRSLRLRSARCSLINFEKGKSGRLKYSARSSTRVRGCATVPSDLHTHCLQRLASYLLHRIIPAQLWSRGLGLGLHSSTVHRDLPRQSWQCCW